MRRIRFYLLATLLAAFGVGRPALADTQVCSNVSTSLSIEYYTCLTVINTTVEIGRDFIFKVEVFSRAPFESVFSRAGMNIKVYDEHPHVLTTGTSSSGGPLLLHYAFTDAGHDLGNHTVHVDPDFGPDSPNISMTVNKFTPLYSVNPSTTRRLVGQTVTITHTTQVYNPNGQIAFYVRAPGVGIPVEYVPRHNVSSAGTNTYADSTTIPFVNSPFNVPGPYAFSVAYVGANNSDSYNVVLLRSSEAIVKVGPYPTTTLLTQSVAESLQGKPVTLTATVTPTPSPIETPTGNVEFYDGTVLVGSAPLAGTTAVLTNTTSLRATGNRTLTARYVGDTWNAASTSSALAHVTRIDPALLVPIIDLILN